MRLFAQAAALAALALAAGAGFAQQRLLPAQSDIAFVSKQMGATVEGHFRKFDAQIAFDPKKPETSRIAFTVDLASASLGAPELEAEVAKAEWFNTKAFPQATFQSSTIKATGPGKFDITGKLSIKGNSQEVTVPVILTQAGGNTTASGGFVIKRLEFHIGDGDWKDPSLVANEVQVRLKLVLSGVGAL